MTLADVLAVADAVMYEGYLLYPYRSTSSKNLSRWQFGVLGPPGASSVGVGEDSEMHAECLLQPGPSGELTIYLRFLQLQARLIQRADADDYVSVQELKVGSRVLTTWDEAVEQTLELGPFSVTDLLSGITLPIEVGGGDETENIESAGKVIGRIVRRRCPLHAIVSLDLIPVGNDVDRFQINVANVASPVPTSRQAATRISLLGAHLVLEVRDGTFVSLLEPPEELRVQADKCQNRRCWPVLAGDEGTRTTVLVSPIILYDFPAVAPESAGALFDSTEIDEILTLRVMTLTDEEKAEARSTDSAAAAIIDRCEAMSSDQLQELHGILRQPRGETNWADERVPADVFAGDIPPHSIGALDPFEVPSFVTPVDQDMDHPPWWDPDVDATASPATDAVVIDGVLVTKGSSVRLHPSRTADAQDLFFANEQATVTAILADVDGGTHIAVVIDNDPAADLHEWYGRYLYFAPEEIEPLR